MISVDQNMAAYIVLLYKLLKINIQRLLFMAKMYPRLFLDFWMMKRRLDRSRKDDL